MQAPPNIKYFLICNTETGQVISEFMVVKTSSTQNEAKQIFEKLRQVSQRKWNERSKIQVSQGSYYFTMVPPNLFLLCLVEFNYPERKAFELIEEINKDHIPMMTAENGELNQSGRQMLKNLIDKFQNPQDKISDIQRDVNEIQLEMKDNIRKVMVNIDDAKKLQETSDRIKNNSMDYRKNAKDLERTTWWNNCKLTLIIAGAVIALILIIVLPIVLR